MIYSTVRIDIIENFGSMLFSGKRMTEGGSGSDSDVPEDISFQVAKNDAQISLKGGI